MEKQKIPVIVLAVFAMAILASVSFIIRPIEAQLSFTTATISYSGNTNNSSRCNYIDETEVWCTSTSGVKIINPTSQSVSSTLYSGISINDLQCTDSYCYSWHNGGTATSNLTQWDISTHLEVNNKTFTMSGGGNNGRSIDALSANGAENVLLPVSESACIGTGSTSLKGLCIFNSDPVAFSGSRFISSGDSGITAVTFGIKWSENTATIGQPTLNNALIFFQDGSGTRTIRIINLSDADTTFATTQTCSAVTTSLGATTEIQNYVYSQSYYIPVDVGSTGGYASMPITSTTCSTTVVYPTIWDAPTGLITDGEFFYTSSYDGATGKSSFQVYNSSSSALATYNITASSSKTRNMWYHSSEGEVQVLADNRLVIFRTQEGSDDSPAGNQNNGRCGVGTALDCVGDRSTFNMITGAPSITNVTSSLLNGLGIIDTDDNPDPQTNGTGLILMLILGTFFATATIATIGVANSKFGAGIAYTEIPKEFWLFLVVGAVSASWYLGWIPDIVFYSLVIGLAGLFSFGLYKHIRGG